MGEYKPGAGLAGAKGFENYIPVIAPKASALATAAPAFSKVASWPDTGYEQSYLSASRPGGWNSKLPSMQQMVYREFSASRAGMGIYEPIDVPSFGAAKSKLPTRVFSTDLAVIDPFGSIENVTGDFLGLQAPLVGSGGSVADPPNYLGERDVELENYPARFLDYGFSTIPMIAAYMMGVQQQPGTTPKNADGSGFFPFENQPEYWASLKQWKNTGRPPTDEELLNEAKQEAAKVSMSPNLMVPALFERYKWGRDVMVNSMSSGNNRIDYMAKKALEAVIDIIEASPTGTSSIFKQGTADAGGLYIANTIPGVFAQFGGATSLVARSLFTLLPGVGTPLAETLMPVDDKAEQVWGQLSADQRRDLLAGAGMLTMTTDIVAALPLLSGAGALASALTAGAKGGEFMAWAAKTGMVKVAGPGFGAYERVTTGWTTSRAVMNVAKEAAFNLAGSQPIAARAVIGGMGMTLTVMDRLMAAGMASMLGNWALESMVPGYAEAVGYAIDNSRPVSSSMAAGLVNNIGYFSSATGGAWTLARTTKALPTAIPRGIGKVGAVADRAGLLGQQELRGFAGHFGGMMKVRDAQAFTRMADGSPMTEAALLTPVKADVFSMLGKQVDDLELARAQMEFIDNPALAHLDPQARVDMFNEAVATALLNRDGRAVDLANLLNAARSPMSFMRSLKLTDEMRRTENAVAKVAREVEDRMAAALSRLYSENRWNFRFRTVDIPIDPQDATLAYRGWLKAQAARMGWQFDETSAVAAYGKDVNEWRQYANLMHANEFYAKNAQVLEAASISPTEFLAAHPEDYFLMRSDHLFQDRADLLRSAISSRGTDAALLPDDELRALVAREIRTTQELDEWWSRLHTKDPDPANVDLDELLDFIEQAYSILPGRHPHVTLDPLTADFPINALARQLHDEGLFSIAYKPKGSIVAYRPTPREMAVRVSRNPPAGYDMAPPPDFTDADTMVHVTTDVGTVRAQGLKAQTQLADEAGEGLMYHGTSADWYVFDPAMADDNLLIGRGLYTTSSPRVAKSYGQNVKVMRIPADARIYDAHASLTQDVADAMRADLAKGSAGRFGTWAAKAGDPFLIDSSRVGPGNWWAFLTNGLDDAIKKGESYWVSFVGDWSAPASFSTEAEFRNAFSEVLADMGFEGLTHTGGRNVGGLGEHKVIVMFNPDSLLARANATGIGMGGDVALGRSVSVYTSSALAAAAQARLTLAVRASRGEATVAEIVDHFLDAVTPMSVGSPLDELAGRLQNMGLPRVAVDTRENMIAALEYRYNSVMRPGDAHPLGSLVLDLDAQLFHVGAPVGGKPVALDPAIASAYSAGITTPPSRLAQVDPTKIGQVRVARRTETSTQPTQIPRIAEAEVATLEDGVTTKALSSRHGRDGFVYQPVFTQDIDKMIDEGLKAGKNELANPASWKANGSPMEKWDADYANAIPMTVIRVRHMQGPSIFGDVPSGAIEVMKKDGTWEVLGRMDRPVQDPVPGEALNVWGSRLYDNMMADGVPIADRPDSVWVEVTQSQHDDMMNFGTLETSEWNRVYLRDWDYVRDGRMTSPGDYVIELDRASVQTRASNNPAMGGLPTFESAPKAAVKRIWSYDNGRQDYVLAKEKGRYGLDAGDFYAAGTRPSELRANSNHLWVVDDAAVARHAGWTDDTPQPLDNQWEQPWAGMIEDPTAGATPVYRHVSHIKLRDGTMVQAPFRDYPMNPGDINLGNRTLMGRKYDSIFQGVRSWRMAEHHLAQMARVFGNKYGFSAQQIELFKNRVDHYARSHGYSPIKGHGEVKITPYANARIRSDEVQKIGERTFGSEPVLNRATGQMEKLDYARLFADTHQQAWTLNMSSAITSRIKQFDLLSIGPLSTWIADWVVPMLRFKASMVFRTSELFESKVFASQRGVVVNEAERAAYVDAGLSPNSNLLSSDFGTDPLLESMMSAGQAGAVPADMIGVNGLDDMLSGTGTGFGSSYAIWRDIDDLFTKKGARGLLDDIADPARYKNGLMFDQQIETIRRELPLIIKDRDPEAYRVLSEVLKVPDSEMARFIVDDRILYGRWQRGQASLEDLIQHSNTFAKQADKLDDATMAAIYATEDWQALDTLMRVASLSAQAEAFGTHYFGSYRSALERSINHPLLGIYPASWAYKAAKEWVAFLYDNRTFGHGQLRLGMFPAVAVNSLIKQVNMTVAMQTGEDWEDWLQNGPARNWLFLWNLLLPGDWSSLPLPVARPLRSISRAIINGEWEKLAPWNLAADTLMGPQGRGGIGIIRDMNLAARGLYDMYEYVAMDEPGQVDNLANGLSLDGVQQAPANWSDLVTYPDPEFAPVNQSP